MFTQVPSSSANFPPLPPPVSPPSPLSCLSPDSSLIFCCTFVRASALSVRPPCPCVRPVRLCRFSRVLSCLSLFFCGCLFLFFSLWRADHYVLLQTRTDLGAFRAVMGGGWLPLESLRSETTRSSFDRSILHSTPHPINIQTAGDRDVVVGSIMGKGGSVERFSLKTDGFKALDYTAISIPTIMHTSARDHQCLVSDSTLVYNYSHARKFFCCECSVSGILYFRNIQ